MRVAVIGANGFLGMGIVKELVRRGVNTIACDYDCSKVGFADECITGDPFSEADPYKYLKEPECVLHLAWKDGFKHNSEAHLDNLPAHVDLVRKLASSPLKRMLIMGSMHEVGYHEGGIRAETSCSPESMYGIAKNALRQASFLLTKDSGTELIWLRGYYIVSNKLDGSSVFSKVSAAAQQGKKEFPFTLGENQYDFLDYDDFCSQTVDAILDNRKSGIYNISSGKPEKLADRMERFIEDNGYDIKLMYGAFPDRPYDSPAVWGSK